MAQKPLGVANAMIEAERYLKNYAVFIASDQKVYAVLGIYDAFEDLYPRSGLPLLVKAVLLPFKDSIIYDGLLQRYNMFRSISHTL